MKNFISKTELLHNDTKHIDKLNVVDAVNLMINDQMKIFKQLIKNVSIIETSINKIHKHLISSNDGRLIYTGAGTSGRIAVQDGVELYPTFNWPKKRLDYIIAGGKAAILESIENAEDDVNIATEIVKRKSIKPKDVVIGLAASGNTPFTCKVMEEAKKRKALTISISNNPDGRILKSGNIKIILDTKEEVIAGSTRLKAGTSQKVCLNIISSMVMVKMGKVKNGMMHQMVPTNEKLRKRKLYIESLLE